MPIHGFVGPFGSGKTLAMTAKGKELQEQGRKIFANYRVAFKHEPLNAATLVEMGPELQDCVILVDEIHVLFDSRQSASDHNRMASYFVLQTRKRGVDLLYTTQDSGQVEKRIRDNTDKWILSRKIPGTPFFDSKLLNRYGKRLTRWFWDGRPTFDLYDTTEAITDYRKPKAG